MPVVQQSLLTQPAASTSEQAPAAVAAVVMTQYEQLTSTRAFPASDSRRTQLLLIHSYSSAQPLCPKDTHQPPTINRKRSHDTKPATCILNRTTQVGTADRTQRRLVKQQHSIWLGHTRSSSTVCCAQAHWGSLVHHAG